MSPLLLGLATLIMVGAQLFSSEIGLTNAARAGAAAAAEAVSQDLPPGPPAAAAAADEEGGPISCSSGSCVTVTPTTGSASGATIYVVSVQATISPLIPLAPPLTIEAQAGATCWTC